jgi:hypothetical protein
MGRILKIATLYMDGEGYNLTNFFSYKDWMALDFLDCTGILEQLIGMKWEKAQVNKQK